MKGYRLRVARECYEGEPVVVDSNEDADDDAVYVIRSYMSIGVDIRFLHQFPSNDLGAGATFLYMCSEFSVTWLLNRATSTNESADEGSIDDATLGYGIAAWHLVNDEADQALEMCRRIVDGPAWPAFGHIAAEAELARAARPDDGSDS